MTAGLEHVARSVSKLERSLEFYCDPIHISASVQSTPGRISSA